MKNKYFIFSGLSLIASFVILFSCSKNQEQAEESISANPFAYVGKMHNQGLDYVFESMKANKALTKSDSGKPDFFALSSAGIEAFLQENNLLPASTKAGPPVRIFVSGRVTDPSGLPLAGAEVRLVGTQQVIVTDMDGLYRINVQGTDQLLMFYAVGYHMKMFPTDRTEIHVELLEDPDWDGEGGFGAPVWQPVEETPLSSTSAATYYNRLMAVFSETTQNQAQFESMIAALDSEILADPTLPEADREALLCGTATAIESVNYWLENIDSWEELLNEGNAPVTKSIYRVTGQVICGHSGKYLPDTGVGIKGTTIGTSSYLDGSYAINAPSFDETLVFQRVGYETQEIRLMGRSHITVALQADGSTPSTPVRFWDTTWGRVLNVATYDTLGAVIGIPGGPLGIIGGAVGASAFRILDFMLI